MEKIFTAVVIEPIHIDGINVLKRYCKVIELPVDSTLKDLLRVCSGADAFISRGFIRIPRKVLEAAESIKVIGVHGVGVDHIDVDFAKKRGIQIVRTPDTLTDTVAEFTIGLMLSLLRKIPTADLATRKAEWSRKYSELIGVDLKGKTVGILGLGRVGSAVAHRLRAFDVNLIYYDQLRNSELEKQIDVHYVQLDQLLKRSDLLSIHVPLTNQTYHMISHEEFESMKTGVYIVNTSRGAVVDENALYDALVSEKVAGAALDVFESEPIDLDCQLIELQNVVLTPHLAASSREALRRTAINVAKEVIKILRQIK